MTTTPHQRLARTHKSFEKDKSVLAATPDAPPKPRAEQPAPRCNNVKQPDKHRSFMESMY